MLCAAMLLMAMVSQQPWAAGARGYAKGALEPLEAGMTFLAGGFERVTSVFGDVASLRTRNQRLAAENAQLKRQVAELSALGLDNQTLRQALDFERSYGHHLVAAQVVGRGPDGFSRTMVIDRGSDDGVRAGMVVTSGAGLIGRVRETGPHAAIVQTLADPQSRVSAYLSTSGLEGTVIGGPDALRMEIEPRLGVAPKPGEWVVTSGVGGGYPRGLVVGAVATVDHRDSSTLDHALVAWINDPTSLEVVLVVTDFTPS
jgi:rod shape-determining protein MreC